MAVSAAEREEVASLLGREPRGLEAIARAGDDGRPMVIRVASLVENKPFPTLFWLVDRELSYRIDQAEAGGLIKRLQHRVDAQPGLQRRMQADHEAHIALRASFISAQDQRALQELGFGDVLKDKGIGGIAEPTRIRCLHTWYAAHLVVPNTVGELLEQWWRDTSQGLAR